ncbi:hypothetical protein Aph02nite_27510 [Actinoplanes philippinensis]|nr:hypothetical protein Aph02nite_27510 [Actinoplanes philippinensis]
MVNGTTPVSSGIGSVKMICRRSGVTGRSTPAIAPIAADQAPAAQITASASIGPRSVCTVRTSPPAVSMPVTVTPVRTVTPCRRAPVA